MYTKRPTPDELDELTRMLERSLATARFDGGGTAVLTGAGLSTESGIPDYRGPETRRRARNPVQYRDFLRSVAARRRYWARSMLGWPRIARARPNLGHQTLASLERSSFVRGLITQNVDGLHAQAGSRELVELHGALRDAICLACGRLSARAELQCALERENGELLASAAESAPDGDAELPDELVARFRLVDCPCGGALKPHVVFFGENVPPPRVAQAMDMVERAAALLVVGTSLSVYSGLRFVRKAAERAIPVAIVTLGETRGDPFATLRIDAAAGITLTSLAERLEAQ
jgi:NAD-dependent SIR2 family protein deacetylase